MLTVLKKAGLTDKDVEVVPMSAGAAFMAGKVDAAVTWEPWLSKGASANGKVLVSTKDLPGIIVDSISFRKEVIENVRMMLKPLLLQWQKQWTIGRLTRTNRIKLWLKA